MCAILRCYLGLYFIRFAGGGKVINQNIISDSDVYAGHSPERVRALEMFN